MERMESAWTAKRKIGTPRLSSGWTQSSPVANAARRRACGVSKTKNEMSYGVGEESEVQNSGTVVTSTVVIHPHGPWPMAHGRQRQVRDTHSHTTVFTGTLLIHSNSQRIRKDSRGFTRWFHAIRGPFARFAPQHSRPIRADSRLRHKRFARIRGRYAPIRASTGSHAHRFAGIRGHSRVLIILRS